MFRLFSFTQALIYPIIFVAIQIIAYAFRFEYFEIYCVKSLLFSQFGFIISIWVVNLCFIKNHISVLFDVISNGVPDTVDVSGIIANKIANKYS